MKQPKKPLNYKTEDLKKQFPELQDKSDFVLIPLLDTAFYEYIKQLPNDLITDIRQPIRPMSSRFDSYNAVIDGKIVNITAYTQDIDTEDYQEYWHMINNLSISGEKEPSRKLLENFREFVSNQSLENLIKQTKTELKKGKTYHLSIDMCNFYFPIK